MTIELRVLGPMQLGPDESPIPLGGAKQRGVLALLAIDLGRAVSADALAEALWRHEALPAHPRRTIQLYVSNLRKLIRQRGLDIVGAGNDYRLIADRAAIDVCRFEDLVAQAGARRDDDPNRAVECYRRAEDLWRGRPFLGVEIDELEEAANRSEGLRLTAAEVRLGIEVHGAERPQAIEALLRLVDDEPYREQAAAHLATALYLDGRHSESLHVLAALRDRLRDLGLEPSPSVCELELQILRHKLDEPPVDADRRPAPRLASASASLPQLVASFVGRRRELEDVVAACASARWVTLVGTGGVGKTRLAVEAAAATGRAATFVGLAGTDADGVVPAIIAATRVPILPGSSIGQLAGAFAEQLDGEDALLVLDNAEHVAGQVAAVAGALLHAAAGLTVLVTSRETLAVAGERTVAVEPLSDVDAAELFADRAELQGRSIDIGSGETAEQIRRLCRAIDNLPLAIEMAATRTRLLQLPELVERIDDRFALLDIEMGSELSSRRSLRATITASYERLSAAERTVFDRLAMFPGGCTLDAAEAVCHREPDGFGRRDVVGLLGGLVDRSLLIADQTVVPTRFRMLDTIRQFGVECLATSPDAAYVGDSFAAWALRTVTDAYFDELGARPDRSRRTMADELDNFRAAFETALVAERPEALEIANWIVYLRMIRGEFALGQAWLRRAGQIGGEVEPDSPVASSRAYAQLWLHLFAAMLQGATDRSYAAIDEQLEVLRRTATGERLGSALLLGVAHTGLTADPERGLQLSDEIAARFDPQRDPLITARRDGLAAVAHLRLGEVDQARSLAAASTAALLALPSEVGALNPMRTEMLIAWRLGDRRAIRELSLRLDEIEGRNDHASYDYLGRYWLAALELIEGNDAAAMRLVDELLAGRLVPATRQALIALRGQLLRRAGDPDAAVAALREVGDDEVQFRSMPSATVLAERGWCELALGDPACAERYFGRAVAFGEQHFDPFSHAAGAGGMAAVALARGDRSEAAGWLATADEIRSTAPARLDLHHLDIADLRNRLAASEEPRT